MRASGKNWLEIADDFRGRYRVNARKAMRWAHGLTQAQVAAEWCRRWPEDPKTAQNVSLWESWPEKGHEPSLGVLDRLAQIYRCFIGDLLADFPNHNLPHAAPRRTEQPPTALPEMEVGPLGPFEELSSAGPPLQRIDPAIVGAHRETEQALAGLYRSADPEVALPPTQAYANSLLGLLDQPMGTRERRELASVAAGVHAQVGLWACHMHRPHLAHRYLTTACEIARNTADPYLTARTLGALSYLYSSAPRGGHGGQPERALQLLDQALDLAEHGDSFTRGWLATWRADQHATLGQLAAAQANVEAAGALLSRADDIGLEGFFARRSYGYGMASHLESVQAVVLALGGRADEAEDTFDHVQATAPNARRRIGTYAHAALASVAAREPDKACAELSRAATLASEQNYGMGLARARGVRSRFDPAWQSLSCVRELDELFWNVARHN